MWKAPAGLSGGRKPAKSGPPVRLYESTLGPARLIVNGAFMRHRRGSRLYSS
jgi:hypothetical protein